MSMEMEKVLPTRGQLERQIAQTIQSIYRDQFGHLPSKVVCHLFTDKIAIIAENTVTPLEKLLISNSQRELAKDIRLAVNKLLTEQIKPKISEILEVEVATIIGNSCPNSEYLGLIAILNKPPKIRSSRKNKSINNKQKNSIQ